MPVYLRHLPGDWILSRFEILEPIGTGAHGSVYLVYDHAAEQQRALKEQHVFADPLATQHAMAYFRQEAAALALLRHPNLPTAEPLDSPGPHQIDPATGLAGESDAGAVTLAARHYLLFGHGRRTTLADQIAESRRTHALPTAEAVMAWLAPIASALAQVHDSGLVHRDIKPANILTGDGHRPLLIDFSLARQPRLTPGYGTVPLGASGRFGTPGYAPPDPAEQEEPVPASDIYALAMAVRETLTGLDPQDPADRSRLTSERLADLRGGLEPWFAEALDRAVDPSWTERPGSADEFLRQLREPPAPVAAPAPTSWLLLQPPEIQVGPIAPGEVRDLTLLLRDRRRGRQLKGEVKSSDENLRLLPPTRQGSEFALHLLLKIPRDAKPGQHKAYLTVKTREEVRRVPVCYTVDPQARRQPLPHSPGCLLGLIGWLWPR